MTIIGGAVLPPVMGYIYQHSSIAPAYAVPLVAYLVIAAFSLYMTRKAASEF